MSVQLLYLLLRFQHVTWLADVRVPVAAGALKSTSLRVIFFDLLRPLITRLAASSRDLVVRIPAPLQCPGGALLQLPDVIVRIAMTLRLDYGLGFCSSTQHVSVAAGRHKLQDTAARHRLGICCIWTEVWMHRQSLIRQQGLPT